MQNSINLDELMWKSEYNIGNVQIDNEHQKLFSIARKALKISQAKEENSKNEKLKEVITELFEYVSNHFNHEQKFMEQIKYPEVEHHKTLHQNMIKTLKGLIAKLNKLSFEEIEKTLIDFIDEYFVKHIITEDKKIHLWQSPLEEIRKNFGWKHIYSVNNSKIDQEHQQLFDIAKEAFRTVDDENRNKKIKEILTDLYEYMKTHFKDEEEYMKNINYPDLKRHQEIHKHIITELNTFVKKLPELNPELFEKELAKMIDISLVQHIIQEDRKIIAYQQSKTS